MSLFDFLSLLFLEILVKYLIACLGNPLMGDDGVGSVVAHELAKQGYEVVTCGSDLSPVLTRIEEVDLLIIVDAVDWGAEPGSVFVARLNEVSEVYTRSSHRLGVTDMLKVMMKVFGKPVDAYLVGIQPKRVEPATELTSKVKPAVDEAVARVKELIEKVQENKI